MCSGAHLTRKGRNRALFDVPYGAVCTCVAANRVGSRSSMAMAAGSAYASSSFITENPSIMWYLMVHICVVP
jgi:hypothetical protein